MTMTKITFVVIAVLVFIASVSSMDGVAIAEAKAKAQLRVHAVNAVKTKLDGIEVQTDHQVVTSLREIEESEDIQKKPELKDVVKEVVDELEDEGCTSSEQWNDAMAALVKEAQEKVNEWTALEKVMQGSALKAILNEEATFDQLKDAFIALSGLVGVAKHVVADDNVKPALKQLGASLVKLKEKKVDGAAAGKGDTKSPTSSVSQSAPSIVAAVVVIGFLF